MPQGAYYDQKPTLSPTGLAVVVALHAAALAALWFIKGPTFVWAPPAPPTEIFDVQPQIDPPPVPPEPSTEPRLPTRSLIDTPPRVIEMPPSGATGQRTTEVPPFNSGPIGEADPRPADPPVLPPAPPPPLPAPVRIEAQVDPRYAGAMQPPYPTSEERMERTGRVVIRVTIGADGRVRGTERVFATNDAFWRATESHARSHWRFRPATLDGRPIESVKQLTVQFELRDR
jgi:periplasmic protein TonB